MGAYSKITNAFSKYPLLRGMASYSIIWPTSSLIQQTFEGKRVDNYDWWRCVRYGLYGSCYVAPTLYSWLTIANVMWPGSSIRAGIIKVTAAIAISASLYQSSGLLIMWGPVGKVSYKPISTGFPLENLNRLIYLPIINKFTHISRKYIRSGISFTKINSSPQLTFVETITYTPFAMCSFYFGMSLLESKPFNEAIAEVEAKFLPTYKVGAAIWPAVAMVNFCLIPPRNRVPFISLCSLVWTCFLAYMKHIETEKIVATSSANPIKVLKANL